MPGRSLDVLGVTFFPNEDGVAHHTDKFQSTNGACYLRRGQEFHLIVLFAGRFDPRFHRVRLLFGTGPANRLETSSSLSVAEPDGRLAWPPEPSEWGARRTDRRHDRAIAIKVVSPTWLPVGKWELKVQTELLHFPRSKISRYTHPDPVYFLFNPWNKEDTAFLEDSNLLSEYVLNDFGHVWSPNMEMFRSWEYGQFEACVLPAFELAMERDGHVPHHKRGNAVHVARAIARVGRVMVTGRWGEDYSNGTAPWDWEGSIPILKQYLENKGKPVRYGQCWVYAGVAATFFRALGLPARMVTNWSSGHDEDYTLTLDVYFDEELELLDMELLWNYHCWTDVWMQRPDLHRAGHEYDGWQVVDGTYNIGPAPVKAVHEGDTNVYFVSFIFPEVNGDYALWMRKRDGTLKLLSVDEKMVGRAIVSDDPFSINGIDISSEYKPLEGSSSERMAVWHAATNSHLSVAKRRRRELDAINSINDVIFKENNPLQIAFGEDFAMSIDCMNKSDQKRTVTVELIVDVVSTNNTQLAVVKTSGKLKLTLGTRESQTPRMWVDASEYAPLLRPSTLLRCRVKSWVRETDQAWHSFLPHSIEIAYPKLNLKLYDDLELGRTAVLHISLDRTVSVPLTGCQLQLSGSALEFSAGAPIDLADLHAGEMFSIRVRIEPIRAGERQIRAKLWSSELPTLRAVLDVMVSGAGGGGEGGGGAGGGDLRARNFRDHIDEILSEAFEDSLIR